jgi:hypothetical protein
VDPRLFVLACQVFAGKNFFSIGGFAFSQVGGRLRGEIAEVLEKHAGLGCEEGILRYP